MRPKRFVKALRHLKFDEVLEDQDVERVTGLFREAINHSADHVLVGFRVRGPVFRVVWAVVEVIPLGTLTDKEDLNPGLPPSEAGYEAWDFYLDGFTFSEGPGAELVDLDDAKPPKFKDSPTILLSYPGRVSWDKLQETTERMFR
jgi:hypothetical protein